MHVNGAAALGVAEYVPTGQGEQVSPTTRVPQGQLIGALGFSVGTAAGAFVGAAEGAGLEGCLVGLKRHEQAPPIE